MAGCSFPKSNSPIGMKKNKTSNSPIVLYVRSGESCISQLKYTIAMRWFSHHFQTRLDIVWLVHCWSYISYHMSIFSHTQYIYICIHIATAPYSLIKSPCWCIESTTESTRPPVFLSTTHQMRLSQLHAGHSGLVQPGCQGQVRTSSGEIIYICIVIYFNIQYQNNDNKNDINDIYIYIESI